MKALTKISIGFLALAAVALWFTSCSSEDVASGTNQGNQESILLLSFNTGKMGTRATTTTNPTDEEKKIEDMTIGIYSSDGQKLRTVQTLTKANGESEAPAGSNKFYIDDSGNAVAKIVTTAALTAGDQVLVAANTGGSVEFSKKGNVDGFKSVEIDATTALTGTANGTTLTATKLPKFGASSGKLQQSSNKSEFTASDIKLKNLVSKITLKSITVNFTSPGPYASATFVPQEMYLESVPAKMQFSETAWVGDPGSSYLSGKDADKGFLKVTLSTPSGEGASKVLSASNPKFTGSDADVLYTIPNIKTDEHKTVLVIVGKFSGEDKDVYYKMPLNVKGFDTAGNPTGAVADGTSAFQIPSGKNIKCNITIKTIGSTNPDAESGPLTATLTVTVDPWDDLDQNTTFQ